MANAKRCDICGEFYDVPEVLNDYFPEARLRELNYITIHKADEGEASMYFDSCEKCQQAVLDFILSRHGDCKDAE